MTNRLSKSIIPEDGSQGIALLVTVYGYYSGQGKGLPIATTTIIIMMTNVHKYSWAFVAQLNNNQQLIKNSSWKSKSEKFNNQCFQQQQQILVENTEKEQLMECWSTDPHLEDEFASSDRKLTLKEDGELFLRDSLEECHRTINTW